MAYVSIFVLVLFVSISGIPATENNLDLLLAERHETWMIEHGKTYKDSAERAHRFMIFKQNIKYIEDFNNAGNYSYTLRINQFADLTAEEFAAKYMGARIPETAEVQESLRSVKYELPEPVDLPASVDWRTGGYVTPVKDQGACGSCWAFATVATIESLHAMRYGRLYRLSEQQLVDCDSANYGCNGGWPTWAYEYILANRGITAEEYYPYVGIKQTCNSLQAMNIFATISGYRTVPVGENSLMSAVAQQPVSVIIRPPVPNWQFSGDGIFDGPCGDGTGHLHALHAVTIVGYGADQRGSYWIVKNSWGTDWGDRGYIKMRRSVADNGGLCGIAERGAFPTM